MKTNWTSRIKPQVLQAIGNAGITNKEAIKCILTFERRVNTCRNMLGNGASWDAVCNSYAEVDAQFEIDKLKGTFASEWASYCNQMEICPNSNVNDFLA